MRVSVVTCAYHAGRFDDLVELVGAVGRQTYRDLDLTIVVDGNRELHDRIVERLAAGSPAGVIEARVLCNDGNRGISFSRNRGIEESRGEVVAFIDDDALPEPGWAAALVDALGSDPAAGGVTGDVVPIWMDGEAPWFPREIYWLVSCSYTMTPKARRAVERCFGVNMAFRRDALERVGGFDESFGIRGERWIGGEDTEIVLRLSAAGLRMLFDPAVRVGHKVYAWRLGLGSVAKRSFDGGLSVALLARRCGYRAAGSAEGAYLRHLFARFYPGALRDALRSRSPLPLLGMLYVSTVVAGEAAGYLCGRIPPVMADLSSPAARRTSSSGGSRPPSAPR